MKTRSKLPMLLTELVIMLLVLAICAAVCISIFTTSRIKAKESRDLGNAATWAQSAAEVYKAVNGDISVAASLLGAETNDRTMMVLGFDSDWEQCEPGHATYLLTLRDSDSGAEIFVTDMEFEEIFSLTVKAVAYG